MTTGHRALAWSGALLALVILGLAAPSIAAAHAELEETLPAADATVEGPPIEISATFSEGLEPDSALSLRDAEGSELASGSLDADDPARLAITPVPELAPGSYEVRWTSVTDDGHVERDTWTFTVSASPTASPTASMETAAPSATETSSPIPSSVPSPTVVPSPSADGGGSAGSDTDVVVPIILGLALVALVGGVLLSRRGRTTPPA